MSQIARTFFKLFGLGGTADNFGQFGSKRAGSPVTSKDVTVIQALDAWTNGIQDAVVAANKAPYLQDLNGLFYAFANQIAYLLQSGIPEWDPQTPYYTGNYVVFNTLIYECHGGDPCLNQTPPDQLVGQDAFWRLQRGSGAASGTIAPYAGATVPWDYLLCDGAAVSRAQYPQLFTAIGTAWGIGDGTTTFNVPDLRGKTLFGNAGTGTFNGVGTLGGSETHTHSQPAHSHAIGSLNLDHSILITSPFTLTPDQYSLGGSAMGINPTPSGVGSVQQWYNIKPVTIASNTATSQPTIGTTQTVPPFAVINYIIKT